MSITEGTVSVNISFSLVDEIKHNIQGLPEKSEEAENYTIYRVPARIRKKNKDLYKPRMVSIGPYYHHKDAFQAMERHKWHYLRDYLSRNTRNSIEHCINELRGLESQARRCYFEEVQLQSDQFLMMMLLDGCFIIEFMIKLYKEKEERDVIFDVGWCLPVIRSDLLLLENQIPFFVIKKLYSLLTCSYPVLAKDNTSVATPISQIPPLFPMLSKYLLSDEKEPDRPVLVLVEVKHILHLYHLCYVQSRGPSKSSTQKFNLCRWLNPIKIVFYLLNFFLKLRCRKTDEPTNKRAPRTIASATELNEAGIKFKCKESENILDISFENGTLEIPFISIEETRRSRLLNLVSFEQCNGNLDRDLTSYAHFMGCLFKTARDVTLLQEKGIVDNLLATNEELVLFFDWLTECSYLDYEKHYLKELFVKVNKYCSSDWHKWRAMLKRNYFSNPWLIISFAAAFFLLALTVLQTVYSVLSYYHS